MTKYVTEIWVQFSSYEAFSENQERLSGILKRARGKCNLYVFMRDTKVCYQSEYCFDEAKINLLTNVFGSENVRAITKPVQVKSHSDFKDCCGDCIERIAEALERIADALEGGKQE